jgi:class 3 adenylate cyclase
VVTGLPAARTLTLLSVRIDGWAEREAGLRPDERAGRLLEYDRLVVPALRAFEGRRALVQGEALTGAFASPTNAVLCARAIQDRVAGLNERALASQLLELRVALHAGELAAGRVEPGRGPLAVAEAVCLRTPPGGIWLTRAVALTMNQREAPVEPVAEALEGPGGERLALYQVRPEAGPRPYGGREAARVPAADHVSRLVAPVSDSIASLEDGGEGRGRALLRVGGASAKLLAVTVAEAEVLASAAVVAVAGRVAGLGREPPWAARALDRLRGSRAWLGRQRAIGLAALERPLGRPPGRPGRGA